MTTTQQPKPNPRRKLALLQALSNALGEDLSRRELSVAQLEALAAQHGVDVSKVTDGTQRWGL